MKKYIVILAVGVSFTLTACGSGSATTEQKDSAAVANIDTTAKTADSTAAVVDTTATK